MKRVVFMGSPDFAVPVLQALIEADDFDVVGVVTQPDRPAGRGGEIRQQPIKQVAVAAGLAVYQPEKLRGEAAIAHLSAWQADVHVVAAYGQILKPNILEIPPFGSINVHASLLPRWRGAAPIQAAIKAGDTQTGITIMQMDAGLDTGAMLLKESVDIAPDETGETLHDKLAAIGGPLLLRALRGFMSGEITPEPQNDDRATYARQIKKEEGEINWEATAIEIDRHVRAFTPWPGTYTHWDDKRLKIVAGTIAEKPKNLAPGMVASGEQPLMIGTGAGVYLPEILQLAGKKAVSAADFVNGNADIVGATLR